VETLGGTPRTALDTLQSISSTEFVDPRIILGRAEAQESLGQFEDESKTLRPLIDEHSTRDLVRAMALADRCWVEYNQRDIEGSTKKALEDCREAESIFNDKEDALGQGRCLTREALVLAAQGDKNPVGDQAAVLYKQALDMQSRAIEIAHQRGAIRDEAGGRHNLADLLMEKTPPDSEAARTQFEKSQELFQSLGDKAEVAGVENDVSVRLMQLCRYKEALASAEIAQQNWSAIGSAKEATALANMASMQLYLGDVRARRST
jgi:tetratricopeptide (TPR) repeat protein